MNIIEIMGNLGSDPVTRFTGSGQEVTSFTMATNVKKGESTVTIWYRITIWGDRFKKMMPYLKKGTSLIVVGELQEPKIYEKEGKAPQVQLEIWAEILRFNPFGNSKGDRPAQDNQAVDGGQEKSFNQSTSQPAYGTARVSYQEEGDDDGVPF